MEREDFFYFGKIVKTHGLKGEVTLRVDDDNVDYGDGLKYVMFDVNGAKIPYFITNCVLQDKKIFVSFSDFDTLEKAETLIGKSVFLPSSMRPELEDGEILVEDLKGFEVIDSVKGNIGKINDVMENPTQCVLQILVNGKEVLIPFHDDLVEELDVEAGILKINAPEGLIDMYLDL